MTDPNTVQQKPPAPRLTPTRRLLLVLFGLALAGVLLLLVEGSLRLAGYGRPAPLFEAGATLEGHGTALRTNDEWARRFFLTKVAGQILPVGSSVEETFFTPKPSQELRVAVIGESTVQGYPYMYNLTISHYLEAMLADAFPDREVRAFNFGFTAVASYPVSRITEEVLDTCEPDAVVIMVGHNEFYGAYGVASSQYAGESRGLLAAHEAYNSLRFVKLMRGALGGVTPDAGAEGNTEEGLIEYMAKDAAIGSGDKRRETAASLLEANIRWSVRLCQKRNVPVIVTTMPSNLSGFAPVGDSPDALPETGANLAGAMQFDGEDRLSALEQLATSDPNHALLWFRLGEAREEAGQPEAAREAYVRARDLDGMPWRAPTASNEAIRRAAQAEGVPLVDCVATFQTATDSAAPGWDLFDDHVHPSIQGRLVYARSIAAVLFPLLGNEDGLERLQTDAQYNRLLGGDHLLSIREAIGKMRTIFSSEPLSRNNREAWEMFDKRCKTMEAIMSKEEMSAWQAHVDLINEGIVGPPPAAVAGTLLMRNGEYQKAAYQFRITRRSRPFVSLPFVQAAWSEGHCRRVSGVQLGEPLERDLERALVAIELMPSFETGDPFPLLYGKGRILWVQERFDEALATLREARELAGGEMRTEVDTVIQLVEGAIEYRDSGRPPATLSPADRATSGPIVNIPF